MFFKHVGIKDSDEVEVLAILEALRIYQTIYQQNVIVESDSANGISWVKSMEGPWKMEFLLNEIDLLVFVSAGQKLGK